MSNVKLFCLPVFKEEVEKLRKNNSYRSIDKDVIDYFVDKTKDQLESGTRLNHDSDAPYIKKRLEGRGGFRVYFLLVIKDNKLYLMCVHPKTGSDGSPNITDEYKAEVYKKVVDAIKNHDLYEVKPNEEGDLLLFTKLTPPPINTAATEQTKAPKKSNKSGKKAKKSTQKRKKK